jgi:LmbE family N-acetylglucosaminyl deacetylase
MKKSFLFYISLLLSVSLFSQAPKSNSAADILQQMKKLEVFGSVLYIAAHPDDENTRLLAYLANERRLRTGYLSLTRGDGGQNLIGDEQGVDLGLIRTQELLAARRVDGAEQFFSTAYDFGYSKSPEEALEKWGHDKILSDVVWVIRNFKPDVIITRFPTTGEGGHGHHTASAIVAGEAFEAAADPAKFPEQLKNGVTTWQAKRLLWNTFNFGGNNTIKEDQLKIDVGGYNSILGKSYGELAAESRSQHKSQGFGVPAQRGQAFEYFSTIKGSRPAIDLMDGVETSIARRTDDRSLVNRYNELVSGLINNFSALAPQKSVGALEAIYKLLKEIKDNRNASIAEELIASCAGLFMEVTAVKQLNVVGDSLPFNVSFINRLGLPLDLANVNVLGIQFEFENAGINLQNTKTASTIVQKETPVTQPYWLEYPMNNGSFEVRSQQLIGKAENEPLMASFEVKINGSSHTFKRPIRYKYTDPVKGELYEPVQLVHPAFINAAPSLIIFANDKKNQNAPMEIAIQANKKIPASPQVNLQYNGHTQPVKLDAASLEANGHYTAKVIINSDSIPPNTTRFATGILNAPGLYAQQQYALRKIHYDHIPDIYYNYKDQARIARMDLKIAGSRVGYIAGAGDKVPQALQQMGYSVVMLEEKDITLTNLQKLDAIVTGVRAYNTNDWLGNVYEIMMQYVQQGGVLLVQYNTNSTFGPMKGKIGPYPFTISRNRVTDENATVNFLLPKHPALNYPNVITNKDFEGWIQERSIYHAETTDSHYQHVFSMKDPGEKEHNGSLIIADYGKGRFVYTGLGFF